jgi:hypothetical protein
MQDYHEKFVNLFFYLNLAIITSVLSIGGISTTIMKLFAAAVFLNLLIGIVLILRVYESFEELTVRKNLFNLLSRILFWVSLINFLLFGYYLFTYSKQIFVSLIIGVGVFVVIMLIFYSAKRLPTKR